MNKSSTHLNLNSDKFFDWNSFPLTPSSLFVKYKLAQFMWMMLNFIRYNSYFLPFSNSTLLEVNNFTISNESSALTPTNHEVTPSRFVSDLFWSHLDWSYIESNVLCEHFSVMDIGCGTGIYLQKFIDFGLNISSYVGFDAKHRSLWSNLERHYPFAKFIETSSSNISSLIQDFKPNLFVSQSCLEHIDNDIEVIQQISQYALASNKRVLQIHLVPSEHCLWLYGLHGIRIYSRTSLNRLLKPISNSHTRFKVHGLGGKHTFQVHKDFVGFHGFLGVKQKDIRNKDPEKYLQCLESALKKDLSDSSFALPSFYAIQVFHNC